MKKLITVIAAAVLLLSACSQTTGGGSDSSDSSTGTGTGTGTSTDSSGAACLTVSYPSFSSGTTAEHTWTKNNTSYKETLSFTSASGGAYAYYKAGVKDTTAPSTFTYSSSTGTFTIGSSNTNVFVNGSTYYATNYYYTRQSGTGLYTTWAATYNGVTNTITFKSDGTVSIISGSTLYTGTFTNSSGWITLTSGSNSIKLCYTSLDKLYQEPQTFTVSTSTATGNTYPVGDSYLK